MNRLTRQRLCWLLAVPGVLLPLCGSASVVLLQDPYGVNATSCTNGCDVIGEKEWFDLDKIELNVTSSLVEIKVYSNFKNPNFSPYAYLGTTLQLGIGDLLFEVDGHYKYGIAIKSHAGSVNGGLAGQNVEAGVLYKIANGEVGVMTAEQALQHTSQYTYRYDDPVWLWNNGNNLTNTATGKVLVENVSTVGAGSTQGYYNLATISFTPTAEFLADYAGNAFELSLAAADCANDVLSGYVTGTVPEPGALALFALGLGGLAVRRHKRAISGK